MKAFYAYTLFSCAIAGAGLDYILENVFYIDALSIVSLSFLGVLMVFVTLFVYIICRHL